MCIFTEERQPALPTTHLEEYCGPVFLAVSVFSQFGLDQEVASKEHMKLPSNGG